MIASFVRSIRTGVNPLERTLAFGRAAISLLALVPIAQAAEVPAAFSPPTELASVNRLATSSGNNASFSPSEVPALSRGGRFVVFVSQASDLVATDTNGSSDVFVRDRQTRSTTLVSANLAGTDSGRGASQLDSDSVSADGRFVVFTSAANDLVASDSNGKSDVFVRDLVTRKTTLVSVKRGGSSGGNGDSGTASISANGRFVLFQSDANDLVATDSNERGDVFVRDLRTGTTKLVTINLSGTDSTRGYSYLYGPSISADGRFVAFASDGADLTNVKLTDACVHFPSDFEPFTCRPNVFVRDLRTGTTAMASVNVAGTATANSLSLPSALSPDGRHVAFTSFASDLVATDTNEDFDLFVRDMQTGVTTLVTSNPDGTDSARGSRGQTAYPPPPVSFSADGRFVAFESSISGLVSSDTNEADDVFVRDLPAGITTLVSANREGTDSARPPTECHPEPDGSCVFRPFGSGNPKMSADGRFVAFASTAVDLVDDDDANGDFDVFVHDVQAGSTALVSVNGAGTATGNRGTWIHNISGDGRFVAIVSDASDLVANDANGRLDVFVRSARSQIAFARLEPETNIELSPFNGKDWFDTFASFTLGAESDGIDPLKEQVTIQIGTFSTTIPSRSFKLVGGDIVFRGRVDGVKLYVSFHQISGEAYELWMYANCATLVGTANPVRVGLAIGDDSGAVTVTARFGPRPR